MTRTFLIGVQGEGHLNEDGSSRQDLIRKLRPNESLILQPDPTNVFDRHAVKVLNMSGKQLGWLPSNARDSDTLLKGEPITATVHAVRGGTNWFKRLLGKKSVGLVLRVTKEDPDWSKRAQSDGRARQYDERVIEALKLEKEGHVDEAIISMRQIIDDIKTLTLSDPQVSAHRRIHSPIDRLSLLLERRNQLEEALEIINKWQSSFDPIQPNNSIKESIVKRAERIKTKIQSSKS